MRNWSPEQIRDDLARSFPDRPEMHVSHETIYQSLFVQGRGHLRADLHKHLRTGRAIRRHRGEPRRASWSKIRDMVLISERPAEADDRAVPGHWEGDLIVLRRLALDTNAQGGYIAGVGLQAHVYDLDTDTVSADDLTTTLERFDDAGLLVRISENDVTDSEGQDAQAEQYATILATCLRSEACVSYTTWGVDDRYDWFTDEDGRLQQGHDLLFDDGSPTPAYDALREALAD